MTFRHSYLFIPFVALLAAAGGLFSSAPTPAFASHIGSVSAGGQHTCVLTYNGGVKCWGRNHFGQLGNGTIDPSNAYPPGDVTSLTSGVAQVSAGGVHNCALTNSGGVKCWGGGSAGQLGDGLASDSSVPVSVSGLSSGVSKVFTGYHSTCAIMSVSSVLKCWGYSYGNTPQDVSALSSGVTYASLGVFFTCALQNGGVKCWGNNDQGELGDGGACGHPCSTPVSPTGLSSGVVAITGGEDFTCALTTGGAVKCWGGNYGGQLGDGQACGSSYCATPVTVAGLGGVMVQVLSDDTSSVGLHSCIVTTLDLVKCWGYSGFGQVDGNTSPIIQPAPVNAPVVGYVASVAPGGIHTCAQSTSGSVFCWGDDYYGQSSSFDGDGDNCRDGNEFGPNPATGGRRDALNPYDYFNPTGDGQNRIDDISIVVSNYGEDESIPGSDYDMDMDRTMLPGAAPWQFGAPDGTVRIFDVTAAVWSYGHDCPPP
jgi:alpha-tubulin suppressor-like RCC1 family protein